MAKEKHDAFQMAAGEYMRMKNGEMRHIKTKAGLFTIKKGELKDPSESLLPKPTKSPSRIVRGSKGF